MSQVFYRWGAGRDESRVKFDGTHISVFDFKRQVMLDNNLGNGKDFDLVVLENGEELRDDNHQIARSSSLVARRRPAVMKGRGTAQNYIVGTDAATSLTGDHRIEAHAREAMKEKMFGRGRAGAGFAGMSKRFDGKEDKSPQVKVTTGDAEEDAKIQAMLQQQSETWEDMAADMSTQARFQTRSDRRPFKAPGGPGGANKFDFSVAPDKEPPVGYICYRCGQKGHWIQNCPTNDDPAAQDRKRFVRVTGIPRSFLKTVETPLTGEGSSQGAMLTADGGFVRAVPDQRQWQKQAAVKTRSQSAGDDDEAIEQDLTCSLCKKLFREAVRVPCCDTAFCEECIQSYLLEHDFECPTCESKVTSLDKLQPAADLRARAAAYLEEKKKKKEGEEEEVELKVEEGGTLTTDPSDVSGRNPYTGNMPDMNTLHEYQQSMMQTLRNPLVPPNIKAEIRKHLKMTNTNLLQMQMLAAQGLIFGAQMSNAMMANQQMGMMMPGMGMGGMGMGGMGMGGMGMGNMGMGNMNMGGMGNNMGNNGMGAQRGPGRGGFRGGPFRGRGGFARGGARVPSGARGADDPPPEKMQRVA